MTKTLSPRQRDMQRKAAAKREAKAAAHAAMMARQTERREAIRLFEDAYAAWLVDGFGPRPIHPDNVTGYVVGNYDSDAGSGELLRVADSLGITL
jgi:hypothetical protein